MYVPSGAIDDDEGEEVSSAGLELLSFFSRIVLAPSSKCLVPRQVFKSSASQLVSQLISHPLVHLFHFFWPFTIYSFALSCTLPINIQITTITYIP